MADEIGKVNTLERKTECYDRSCGLDASSEIVVLAGQTAQSAPSAGPGFHCTAAMPGDAAMIHGLHHNAYRCRDSEETRRFYEDFLGLPLAGSLEIGTTKTGRQTSVLHTFYQMGNGSYLAFFEDPDTPFDFKDQRDFDLHIALEVEHAVLEPMLEKGRATGIESRGIADHHFIQSIYFRDPNGYVIELTARMPNHDAAMNPKTNGARDILDDWQARKGAGS